LWVYGGSVLLHAAIAVGAILLPKSTTQQTVAIELHEAKKKRDPPKPPPPPPQAPPAEEEKPHPTPAREQARAKVESVPKAEAPPPVPLGADGFADLGVALGNAESTSSAAPGLHVAAAPPAPLPAATASHRVEQLVAHKDNCTEPVVRPKRQAPVAPKYTLEARQAEVEGVVRVEVTVDEAGHVVNAHVVSGLGYGLDEAALAAARASTFEPASRCGKPVIGTIVLPFRFQET
jgi:periplasmic protein TonB